MASSSSTPSPQWEYDVFLSFRGKDTRYGFVNNLFEALCREQINTFIDQNLDRGEEVSIALLQTIAKSRISIVILSENYADSPWCLDELVKITECRKLMGQIVLPVFYEINPTDVQELTGSYRDALLKHQKRFKDCMVESWGHALKETAEVSGFVSRNIKPESKLIEEIVKRISEKIYQACPCDPCVDGLIGAESRIKDIQALLCTESTDRRIVGIWGMGGIGKTTIASKLFDLISSQFQFQCFVANVKEKLEKCTLDGLQQEILSKLVGKENSNLGMSIKLSSTIRKWTIRKRVLIVLDDVSDFEQIEYLVGAPDFYGPGSRIVITCRNKQVLENGGAEIYEVKRLKNHEALQLFSLHAFKQNPPPDGYIKLTKRAVKYAQGNPLALKVFGSNLYNKSKEEWEDELEKLENSSDKKIQKILRISYEELDDNEKEIFLHVACFFKSEERNHVESVLKSCGFFARIGISRLLDKSLITIDAYKRLQIHDLLQQMGKDIVLQECANNPAKRSRLWIPQDIIDVFTKTLGPVSVQSISLDMSKVRYTELCPSAFARMAKLRFLKFYVPEYWKAEFDVQVNVHWSRDLSSLPDELRYLCWYRYPSKSLPLTFWSGNLVQLHLIHSHVQQLGQKDQSFENLKVMDLSYSVDLIEIPDLSKLPRLEVLHLKGCTSLVEIGSSILYDSKLVHMDLKNCESLCSISSRLHFKNLSFLSIEGCPKITEFPKVPQSINQIVLNGTAIEQVPQSIRRGTSLTKLSLVNCTRLETLPSSIGELRCLRRLNLNGCSKLLALPNSTGELKSLEYLSLNKCSKLMNLPDELCNLRSLINLDITACRYLKALPENLGNLESLKWLYATRSGIKTLPSSINGLSKLVLLYCDGCKGLVLPPFTGLSNLSRASLQDCGMIEIPSSVSCLVSLRELYLGGNNLEMLPASIQQLPKLETLSLRDCKRIKCLPDLPSTLQYLVVTNCMSLESVSTSLTNEIMDSLCCLDTGNCMNLNQNECRKIVDCMLLRLESMLPQLKLHHMSQETHHHAFQELDQYNTKVYTYKTGFRIAGSELPQRMSNQNISGSSLLCSLRPYPHDFLVLAFCAVVEFKDSRYRHSISLGCECRFVAESGHTLKFLSREHGAWYSKVEERDRVFISKHTFFWYSTVHIINCKCSFSRASFEFYPRLHRTGKKGLSPDVEIIKCGVHLLYDNNVDNPPSLDRGKPSKLPWAWRSSYTVSNTNIKFDEDQEERATS